MISAIYVISHEADFNEDFLLTKAVEKTSVPIYKAYNTQWWKGRTGVYIIECETSELNALQRALETNPHITVPIHYLEYQ
jgi:hypothetical protein